MVNYQKIGVIGAGQMGLGIARLILAHDGVVLLCEHDPKSLDNAVKKLHRVFADNPKTMERLIVAPSISIISDCDICIEAVVEDLSVKQKLLKEIEVGVAPTAVIASNTSSLSIELLSQGLSQPERFLGVHFMNPAHVMALVELIACTQTASRVVSEAQFWLEALGKKVIRCADKPGFVVNRLLLPLINAAAYLAMEKVADVEAIDVAMHNGAGHPLGPLRLADTIGIDTCVAILERLYAAAPDQSKPPCPLLTEMVRQGCLGRKTGRGFYSYETNAQGAPS